MTVAQPAAVRTRGHREGVAAQTNKEHDTSSHMPALARRNLFVAMSAAMCAPVATALLLPPAARAATLRDMTAGESAAFTAAMENLFNEGFDSPRPDRFVRPLPLHTLSCCSPLEHIPVQHLVHVSY